MLPILSLLACLPSPHGAESETSPGGLEPAGLDAVVEAAPEDGPCSGAFSTNTQVSLARGEVVIERFGRRGGRERVEVPLAEVRRLVHARWELEEPLPGTVQEGSAAPAAGTRCSTLWLVLEDGRQILFDDDPTADLGPRASRLAELIGVPLGPPEPTVELPAEGAVEPADDEALAEATVAED